MIYIVIPESFSASEGVALAKIAADIMRYEPKTVVVCPASDDTWGYAKSRIMVLPLMGVLRRVRGFHYIPVGIRRLLLTRAFRPLLSQLQTDDVVWFVNWCEMAEPIRESIRQAGAKLVYHIHNSHAAFATEGGFFRLDPDAIVFLSDAMRQEVETQTPSRTHLYTIHNGCEESRFWPSEALPCNEPPVVLFVGRVVPYKGVHVLIQAIKILNERSVPVWCRVVGSAHALAQNAKATPYVTSLHSTAPPNVSFAGFRSGTQIAEEYRASDILCCPSIFPEPFGLVNIEAMACGLPVVASRTGGIPEIAAGGGILLFETGDAEDLANKLQRLLSDRNLRMQLREEGLSSFKRRFRSATAVEAYLQVVSAVTTHSSPKGEELVHAERA